MSTRDMMDEVNNAYKLLKSHRQGHYLASLAEYIDNNKRVFPSIYPNCGPLIIINETDQGWYTGNTVSFTYKKAEFDVWATGYVRGLEVPYKTFTEVDGEFSGSVYIGTGTRAFKQHFFNNDQLIHQITSIGITDEDADISIYCLADNGAKLVYPLNTEIYRDDIDKLFRGLYASPERCVNCGGKGTLDNGNICEECEGYGYLGYNAEGYLLNNAAKAVGIGKRMEDDPNYQMRAWIRKWWKIPTKKEIIKTAAYFMNISEDLVDVREQHWPQAMYTISTVGKIAGETGQLGEKIIDVLEEMVELMRPVGVQAKYEFYTQFQDDPEFYPKNLTGIQLQDQYNSSFLPQHWYGDWIGTSFWYGSGYFEQYTGIQQIDYSGYTQGVHTGMLKVYTGNYVEHDDDNFFSGISNEKYESGMYYDNYWGFVT